MRGVREQGLEPRTSFAPKLEPASAPSVTAALSKFVQQSTYAVPAFAPAFSTASDETLRSRVSDALRVLRFARRRSLLPAMLPTLRSGLDGEWASIPFSS